LQGLSDKRKKYEQQIKNKVEEVEISADTEQSGSSGVRVSYPESA
jgi:hypothetical protein